MGDHGCVEDIGLRLAGDCTRAARHIHRRTQRPAEGLTVADPPCVQHATRRKRVQRQTARTWRREIPVDVDHQLGIVTGIDCDGPTRPRRHDGGIGHDRSRHIIQGRNDRSRLTHGPHGEIAQGLSRNHGEIQGVRLCAGRNVASGRLQYRKIPLLAALQIRTAKAAIRIARIYDAARRQWIKRKRVGVRQRREVAVDVQHDIGCIGA